MNFIKKVFMFLLAILILLFQLNITSLAASEYSYDINSIIKYYFNEQDSKRLERILWIGCDPINCNCPFKYDKSFGYNPYEGTYLTLNGSRYDDFKGQVDINNPISILKLGKNSWDHIVITILPEQKFLDNKCLDSLLSLLRDAGTITVPLWDRQIDELEEKLSQFRDKEKVKKLDILGNKLYSYDYFIYEDLFPLIKSVINDIYKCNLNFEISDCHTAAGYRNESNWFFLGNIEDSGLNLSPRYIVTFQKNPILE